MIRHGMDPVVIAERKRLTLMLFPDMVPRSSVSAYKLVSATTPVPMQ